MARNEMITNEAFATMAKHYAEKIIASGNIPTLEELEKVVSENWSKISNEISQLSLKTMEIM